jgi:hypothetical protein|uniref:Uncharacterized protein n=1 Tax=Ignisphaera aggregans TaxID=334771 RepID=A0A7J2TBM5_9CREN
MPSVCKESSPLYDIEGYAQVGLVRDVKYVSCGKGRVRVLVVLSNDVVICSECLEQRVVELSKRVIELYRAIKLQR